MKKVNITVDLDDNEVLEASVREALVASARQIAREQFQKVLEAEIQRIVEAKVREAKESHYYSGMGRRLADLAAQQIGREILVDNSELNQIIEEKVGSYVGKRLESRGGLDRYLMTYMDKSIANALTRKANESL